MTRLVLFDIDGTLIHTRGAGVRAFHNALKSEFGVDSSENTPGNISFAGRTDSSLVRQFFIAHNVPPSKENFQSFFDAYVFWLDYLLRRTRGDVCPGVDHFVSDLQALPNPPMIGLLTGNIRLGAEIKLRHFYLWEYFSLGAFGDENEDRNQLASLALERGREYIGNDLQPEEIVVVGDTVRDIECAKSIGARCLAVATGGNSKDELLAENPTWTVDNLCHINAEDIL